MTPEDDFSPPLGAAEIEKLLKEPIVYEATKEPPTIYTDSYRPPRGSDKLGEGCYRVRKKKGCP